MECRECRLKLDQYLTGELSGHDAAIISEHITGCTECLGRLESLKQINKLINEADLEIPMIDIAGSVMHKIRTELETPVAPRPIKNGVPKLRSKKFISVLQDLAAAAAAAIIIFWFSGPVMATTELPQYTADVARVSNSVGTVFQSYLSFYDKALDKLSSSVDRIERVKLKGVDRF